MIHGNFRKNVRTSASRYPTRKHVKIQINSAYLCIHTFESFGEDDMLENSNIVMKLGSRPVGSRRKKQNENDIKGSTSSLEMVCALLKHK